MPEIQNARSIEQHAASVTIKFTSAEAAARFFDTHTLAILPQVTCRERVENDETVCPTCGLRWGNDEEKPACPKL